MIEEVLPGVLHWATLHEGIGETVHSHLHVPSASLLDPRVPEGGVEAVAAHVRPQRVLLSSRHHLRHSAAFVDAFACPVLCHEAGLGELAAAGGPEVEGFAFGDEVAPGVTALEVGVLTPEDTAFAIAAGPGALLFADGLIRGADGALAFVPDPLMGDDPEEVKRGLRSALARLLDEQEFDALLFAHGAPLPRGGRSALQDFLVKSA